MSAFVLAALFVGGAVLFAVLGVLTARRYIHHHVAEGHNDVLVPLFLTAGVIYAVLLGFLVVGEWENYDAAHANAAEEAALLVPMYRQTTVMAADKGGEMRKAIRDYIAANSIETVFGTFRVNETGQQTGYKYVATQWQGGTSRVVGGSSSQPIEWPKPKWT